MPYGMMSWHYMLWRSSFECNFCKEKFWTQNAFREHMKIFHFENVSNCKNENECKFGPRKCWFIHQENIDIAYQNAKSEGRNNAIYDMEWSMKMNQELWISTKFQQYKINCF